VCYSCNSQREFHNLNTSLHYAGVSSTLKIDGGELDIGYFVHSCIKNNIRVLLTCNYFEIGIFCTETLG